MSDWSSFTKKIGIDAPLDGVYKAWATQSGIESWFLRSAIYTDATDRKRSADELVENGDTYRWHWYGFPDSVVEENEIILANAVDELQFTFSGKCLVTIKLTQANEQTIVSLTQSEIPDDDNPKTNLLVGCGEGWTFYLANLKSIMEGGIDLRNKDESLRGVINS